MPLGVPSPAGVEGQIVPVFLSSLILSLSPTPLPSTSLSSTPYLCPPSLLRAQYVPDSPSSPPLMWGQPDPTGSDFLSFNQGLLSHKTGGKLRSAKGPLTRPKVYSTLSACYPATPPQEDPSRYPPQGDGDLALSPPLPPSLSSPPSGWPCKAGGPLFHKIRLNTKTLAQPHR